MCGAAVCINSINSGVEGGVNGNCIGVHTAADCVKHERSKKWCCTEKRRIVGLIGTDSVYSLAIYVTHTSIWAHSGLEGCIGVF